MIYVITEDTTDHCYRDGYGGVTPIQLAAGTRIRYGGLRRGRDGGPSYVSGRVVGRKDLLRPVYVRVELVRPE